MKFALGIEYRGTNYCGWQRQPHCDSIQRQLEAAVGYVADHPVELVCAGRTDTGVHAIEQVAHFESQSERSARAWVMGANCRLPRDIRIRWVVPVADDFHARFEARARSYRYLIHNEAVASALFHDQCAWEFRPLDHERMHQCAQILVGEHDFSSFRAVGCQAKSSRRNVTRVAVTRRDSMVLFDIEANAFLYHMVRNIAGSLMAVGKDDLDNEGFARIFAAADRSQAPPTAPAAGLYFVNASYDARFKLPLRARKPVLF